MITMGIDCGARNTKAVIMKDKKIISKVIMPTGFDPEMVFNKSLELTLRDAGLSEKDIQRIAITGIGRGFIKMEYMQVNEMKAIAKGVTYFFPNAKTIIDVGAEESKVIKMDDKGNIIDFDINEKCAAGAGIFIETMARALEVSVEEMSELALKSKGAISINAQCVIFAESEVVSLIHAKIPKEDISKAIYNALAARIVSMIKRVGTDPDVVIAGGVAHNVAFIEAIRREIGLDKIYIPKGPEYIAAIGAAIIAAES